MSKKQKYGHVIGLNLSREGQDGPPITIDGVPFSGVTDIAVVAAPGKGINVIVTFHASHLGGVEAFEEKGREEAANDSGLTYRGKPITLEGAQEVLDAFPKLMEEQHKINADLSEVREELRNLKS